MLHKWKEISFRKIFQASNRSLSLKLFDLGKEAQISPGNPKTSPYKPNSPGLISQRARAQFRIHPSFEPHTSGIAQPAATSSITTTLALSSSSSPGHRRTERMRLLGSLRLDSGVAHPSFTRRTSISHELHMRTKSDTACVLVRERACVLRPSRRSFTNPKVCCMIIGSFSVWSILSTPILVHSTMIPRCVFGKGLSQKNGHI